MHFRVQYGGDFSQTDSTLMTDGLGSSLIKESVAFYFPSERMKMHARRIKTIWSYGHSQELKKKKKNFNQPRAINALC